MKLLCTDMDRTLLPNGEQPESEYARPILWHLLKMYQIKLAYVTGRDLSLVLDAIAEYSLPLPDVIVGDVGSSIYTRTVSGWQTSKDWEQTISRQWGGDSAYIHELLADIIELQVQEPERQKTFKRSYYFATTTDESWLHNQVEARLTRNDVSAALVFSHDPEKQCMLLDVLPHSATKREAVAYVQSMFKLDEQDVLFSGDSGNDVSAICAARPAVLVANADKDTRQKVMAENERSVDPDSTYLAEGGLEVVGQEALNGCYSAGILEGLMHFKPEWREHLSDAAWVDTAIQMAGQHPTTDR